MSLAVILIFWFEFFRILVKNRKKEISRKIEHYEPLCCSVLRRSEGLPRRGEAEGPEKAPSGSLRRSPTMLR